MSFTPFLARTTDPMVHSIQEKAPKEDLTRTASQQTRVLGMRYPPWVCKLTGGTLAIFLTTPAAPPLFAPSLPTSIDSQKLESTLSEGKAETLKDERNLSKDTPLSYLPADSEADPKVLEESLILLSRRVQKFETKMNESEEKLSNLILRQTALRHSLENRRTLLIEILAALQRLGREPLPALFVYPKDALRTIRTSAALGAVLPELTQETATLTEDLNELTSLRSSIDRDHEKLTETFKKLSEAKAYLKGLIATRQKAFEQIQKDSTLEQLRIQRLAEQATDLNVLIQQLEKYSSPSADPATNLSPSQPNATSSDALKEQSPVKKENKKNDPQKIRAMPGSSFSQAKGRLRLPVAGRLIKKYGSSDGLGGKEKGLSIATRSGAVVTSPAEGWVAFSGPYRTYGQILIINVGEGYYIVLAGLARIDVQLGQLLVAGEPIGIMPEISSQLSSADKDLKKDNQDEEAAPVLYVEFRKDGAAVNSTLWWAKADLKKVRG